MEKAVVLLAFLLALSFPHNAPASQSFSITGVQLSATPVINSPVTFSVSTDKANLFYKFLLRSDYGTPDYATSGWQTMRDWSMNNAFTWTPTEMGRYILVVWVVEDLADLPNYEIIGLSFEVTANTGAIDIEGTWSLHTSRIGCGETLTYTEFITVTQNGQNVTLYFPSEDFTVQGVLNGTILTVTNLPISFPAEGGTTTVTSFTATASNSGNSVSFTSNWTWSGYGQTCGGTTSGTGMKQP